LNPSQLLQSPAWARIFGQTKLRNTHTGTHDDTVSHTQAFAFGGPKHTYKNTGTVTRHTMQL
jgi:hypothetical protein